VGTLWGRKLKAGEITRAVGAFEESMRALSDPELRARTAGFKTRLGAGETLDTLLPEVLAAGREAGLRALDQRAVDEQIAGAMALCRGRLVEMKTGEGKTLAIALAAYAWSLPGEGVHVLTANDYLADRDTEWMRPLYAALEERLYREAYGLETERIATHAPVLRIDHAPIIYATGEQRTRAALDRIAERRAAGRPVLVVTASIVQSGEFSEALRERGIPHEVLSAANHLQEAEILGRAGRVGAVTVVTRMGGRGVDIRLGGDDPAEHEAVVRAGGLYVLGFDLYENRRLELQVRGRAGRRGDPGESDVLLSAEDPSTAAHFSGSARASLKSMLKSGKGTIDTSLLVAYVLERNLNKATLRFEEHLLTNFRFDEIREEQTKEIYRLRDEFLDENRAAAAVIDEHWPDHLVALQDVSGMTALHGLSGSDWEARYRQEANRLFRELRARIDREVGELVPDLETT